MAEYYLTFKQTNAISSDKRNIKMRVRFKDSGDMTSRQSHQHKPQLKEFVINLRLTALRKTCASNDMIL